MIDFEWDERKNEVNRKKHGLWFEEAQQIFSDPYARFFRDLQHSGDEDRYVAVGCSGPLRILVVIYCLRRSGTVIRVISARKATKRERHFYETRI